MNEKYGGHAIGKAMAGHAARVQGSKDAHRYDNPLTDLVNMIIAEAHAKRALKEKTK